MQHYAHTEYQKWLQSQDGSKSLRLWGAALTSVLQLVLRSGDPSVGSSSGHGPGPPS